jgi:ribosomal protein S12 methylthiotransferase
MTKPGSTYGPKPPAQSRGRLRAPGASAVGPPVVGLVSLGCCKNLVDSEVMLARIAESGAIISADPALADTVVVNTCGFLAAAREEALATLSELAERKRRGELRRIVVAGCLVQRDGFSLRQAVPEIDALVDVHHREDVVRAVWQHDSGTDGNTARPAPATSKAAPWSDRARLRVTPRHYAYVRISEGCNQKCTFCTIPSIRGPLRSKPPEEIVAECRELISDGARELILIGQDTTSYGVDLGYEPGLAGLLRTLDAACDGACWLRLMYAYPSVFTEATIDAIAECPRVVKYIDLPLQHISDRVLKAMGRRVTRRQTERLLERIRRRIPNVALRSTFMVGFPGETEAEFEELLEFVRSFRFAAAAAFRFSCEPGTAAARLPGQLPESVKQERYQRFMLTQQEVALAEARRMIGQELEVLIDGLSDRPGMWLGRHAGQAPEVDSVTRVSGRLRAGALVRVRCTGSVDYDLLARPVRQSTRRD